MPKIQIIGESGSILTVDYISYVLKRNVAGWKIASSVVWLGSCRKTQRNIWPLTHVARPVLVKRASSASSYSIHILVTLGGILSKVDPSSKHSSNVGVPLIEAFVDDGVYKWRTCRTMFILHKLNSWVNSTAKNWFSCIILFFCIDNRLKQFETRAICKLGLPRIKRSNFYRKYKQCTIIFLLKMNTSEKLHKMQQCGII